MKASEFITSIKKLGIETIIGVPDSTLKQFCDEIQMNPQGLKHFTPANEGAAIGFAVGEYLASGRPACVYMQNSGIGNTINPICSLANNDVYGIPMLLIVGWRGEPGVKDEPQHVFQGKITCELLDTVNIPYSMIDANTSLEDMEYIIDMAKEAFSQDEQYAIVVKKNTFEKGEKFIWNNGNSLVREDALGEIVRTVPKDTCIISTTGKISREVYERSNDILGTHDNVFMTVGGMGHASMIAYGIAERKQNKQILCIDGDGAALMHMGAMAFIASHAPRNYYHIVINNQAHESVGAMPTDCRGISFAEVAKTLGYKEAYVIEQLEDVKKISEDMAQKKEGPILYEIKVSLDSRADLGRPKETARENKEAYMEFMSL